MSRKLTIILVGAGSPTIYNIKLETSLNPLLPSDWGQFNGDRINPLSEPIVGRVIT
jgi:hypothetical protein